MNRCGLNVHVLPVGTFNNVVNAVDSFWQQPCFDIVSLSLLLLITMIIF